MIDNRDDLAVSPAHGLALDCLAAGIEAARPSRAVDNALTVADGQLTVHTPDVTGRYPLDEYDRVLVVGGGKAADELAAGIETALGGAIPVEGCVVTDTPTGNPERVMVASGDHPTPTHASVEATERVMALAEVADEGTLVIAAIAGGGSALLCAPEPGVSLNDLRAVTAALVAAGATIEELNVVRRALSRVKGGGLAAIAAPATVVGILVSDVVGDDPAVIASGPTVPTATAPADALAILERYEVPTPAVRDWLAAADPRPAPAIGVDNYVIAASRDALTAAADTARAAGYEPHVWSATVTGEAREVGRELAAVAADVDERGDPVAPPAVVLAGGETTVTVAGDGTGGPNQELAVAAALSLPATTVLAAIDTDGRDGSTDAAGAIVDAATVTDPAAARAALANNDTYPFLAAAGALLHTGPTGTNVNDIHVVVCEPDA